jgi:hypothetical protein
MYVLSILLYNGILTYYNIGWGRVPGGIGIVNDGKERVKI